MIIIIHHFINIVNTLLDNINVFKTYPFTTINEFVLSCKNLDILLSNDEFLDIFLNKIDNIYTNIYLFNHLNKTNIDHILEKSNKELIIINMYLNIKEEYKTWFLEDHSNKDIIYNTKYLDMYKYIDKKLLKDILSTKKDIIKYHEYFYLLDTKYINKILNNKTNYNSFINNITNNKLDIKTINNLLNYYDLSYQKDFVNNIHTIIPNTLYIDFFTSNIPIYLETIRSNKKLSGIFNTFNPKDKDKILYLLQNLNRDDLITISKLKIDNNDLAKIINGYTSFTKSNITDLYYNTPIDELIDILSNNKQLVLDLINAKISPNTKQDIILSNTSLTDIFLNEDYLKTYDKKLLLSILDNT